MGDMRNAHKCLSENLKGRDHSEDLSVDGKILESFSDEEGGKLWTRFM
jgi:hypothetical protein